MTVLELIALLPGAERTGRGWQAKCPAHEDSNPSLSIDEGDDGRILIKCHAGCTAAEICTKLGLKLKDLYPMKKTEGKSHIEAEYDYTDESGKVIFQTVRFFPKDFRQRQPDAKGGWRWSLDGVRLVPFHLPMLIQAVKEGRAIYVCEGEKDVLALEKAGFTATCNPMGAGKWRATYTPFFKGADVIIIADKDKPGWSHAEAVARQMIGVAQTVKKVECPNVEGKVVKDAADYFAAGGHAADLDDLARGAPSFSAITEPEKKGQTALQPGPTDFESVTTWMRGEIIVILTDNNATAAQQRNEISRLAVEALCKVGRLFFQADLRDFDSALFFNAHTKRLERIRSDAFGAGLSDWLKINRADALFKFAFAAIETAALSGPHTTGILPESFWAARPGALYLSNGDGSAAKITAQCVEIVDNGSDGVLFAAGRTCSPWKLTQPKDIFQTCAIFRNLHTTAGHAPDLLRAWIYSLPTNPPCKPPLCLAGDVGSGKTRLAKAITELYGVPLVAAKVSETGEDDFWPACNAGGIYILDNADTRNKWLADAVANHSTDGCTQSRKLYTNSETVTLRARAWLCITTANPTFAADSGLADRLLLLRMARRDEETSDAALTDEILANRDAGLSHIAATLQKALADAEPTPAGLNARHPDFGAFAVKIGRALGRQAEAITALRTAEADKGIFCLENNSIGAALLAYLGDGGSFTGTASELAPKLEEIDAELKDRLSGHLSPKRLGKRLSALWPHLQKTLALARKDKNRNGVMVFTFKAKGAGCAGFQRDIS
jgi:5S rRNA maturation endonuclease (ribonuclease M5)